MKILTSWLRTYLPVLDVRDAQLAEDLTLRGIAVEGVSALQNAAGQPEGSLFDMDITTNRVDAMNHYGIAREIAAMYDVPLRPLLDRSFDREEKTASPLPVRIEAPDLCGRFTAQVIRGVTIGPSEGRIRRDFTHLGQKQISNAVDVTNFVLLGMGHPTHAFDLDKVSGGLVVRRAFAGEQIKLLDGSTRTLVPEDLVVADEAKALALAGVMGGFDSMITAETRNIVVEAAWFDPAAIRASSRRHLLHTDASHRFERGADFAAAPLANTLVSQFILEACGGSLAGEMIDLIVRDHAVKTMERATISLSVANAQRLLGSTLEPEGITAGLIHQYLTALGCKLTASPNESYAVELPSWRLDLTREIDLIEEIARVYGYNRFANTLPTPGVVIERSSARAEGAVRSRLFALGFSETLFSTFASAADGNLFAPEVSPIPLDNPLSEEAANLRSTLLPGMVAMLAHNLNRDVLSARLFEAGEIFRGTTSSVEERLSLSLGLTGACPATPLHSAGDAPFFELKGAVESIVGLFATAPLHFHAKAGLSAFEPGRCACLQLGETAVATFGQLSRGEAARRKIRQPIYLAELDLAALLEHPLRHSVARELSRFQAVARDFSFTFAEGTGWHTIAYALAALHIPELQRVEVIEIFRDPKKNDQTYSILIRILFQAADRTLRDEELAGWSKLILTSLRALGGTLRS